ncbi:XPG family DNA repair endonuclease [uncultured virus]|nr:XPG family DNA repair endonuclease [uncultured virus]
MQEMTIGGIWAYYAKNVGYGKLASSELRGKLVVVDCPGNMHRMRAVCKKEYLYRINPFATEVDNDAIDRTWLTKSLQQVIEYMSLGFIPIMVFDGKKSHLKVSNAGSDRLAIAKKAADKLQALRDEYAAVDPLIIPSAAISSARTLLESIDRVPRASVEKYKNLMKSLGIPWVQSLGEGERTCSLMNLQGACEAVISVDGDCLAFGAKLILRERINVFNEDGFGEVGFSTAEIQPLLEQVGMEFPLFQQLCIMAGTDFNKNIRGIGFNKAIPLLVEHGSISRVGKKTKHDISILNHREVSKEFTIVPWQETADTWSLDLMHDLASDEEILTSYDIGALSESLARAKRRAISCCS